MNYPPPIYYLIIPALLWSNSGCSLITDFDGANSTEPAVTDAQVGPGLLDMDLGIADIGTPNLDARRIDLSAPDLGPDDQETEPDMLGADAGPRDIDAQCSDAARLVDEPWCQAVAADGAEPNCRTACERVFFCVDARRNACGLVPPELLRMERLSDSHRAFLVGQCMRWCVGECNPRFSELLIHSFPPTCDRWRDEDWAILPAIVQPLTDQLCQELPVCERLCSLRVINRSNPVWRVCTDVAGGSGCRINCRGNLAADSARCFGYREALESRDENAGPGGGGDDARIDEGSSTCRELRTCYDSPACP